MTAAQNRPDPVGPDHTTTSEANRPGRSGRLGTRPGVPRSRMGGIWVALVVAAVVFLFLLIFVLQNGQRVQVSFLGASGTLPMGVALLLAATIGVLLVALPGTARIIQLRMSGRRRAAAAGSATDPPAVEPADSPVRPPT